MVCDSGYSRETGDKGSGKKEKGEGVGSGGREEEEGEESRVDCLSSLIPVLLGHPSLHHMAHSGQLATEHLCCTNRDVVTPDVTLHVIVDLSAPIDHT